ncbi:helix-turn-helix domain-containing protein, partial [Patescibacteria group bacterium]|nr:helix-turn-helix domain-containing protein [Patescibacteria group bacterium]
MDPLLEKHYITTKEAGELSGYSSDYLARLARSEKIAGTRVGHSWFIDRESLMQFLNKQDDRRVDRARALSRAREEEYRVHRSVITQASKTLIRPLSASQLGFDTPAVETTTSSPLLRQGFRAHVLAFSIAGFVILCGAYAAQAARMPQIVDIAIAATRDVADGFDQLFGAIPAHIAARINRAKSSVDMQTAKVSMNAIAASDELVPDIHADAALQRLRMIIAPARHAPQPTLALNHRLATTTMTVVDIQETMRTAGAYISDPLRLYRAVGDAGYAAIINTFAAYRSLIENTGNQALSLAYATRMTFDSLPRTINRINLALGSGIINATHALIGADVSLAYGLAAAAPESARITVALIGNAGDRIENLTARVPMIATTAFARTITVPVEIAPRIAQRIFDAEYVTAARFLAVTRTITDGYLAFINTTGTAAHTSIQSVHDGLVAARTELSATQNSLATVPKEVENTYLGTLGKSSVAIDAFAHAPKVASALLAVHTNADSMLAAIAPALSTGERVALGTYAAINGMFQTMNQTLAFLLGPPPTIVFPNPILRGRGESLTSNASGNTVHTSTTTTASVSNIAVSAPIRNTTSAPTYNTTIVRGITEDSLNQSLTKLRSDLLATVAGMIQPVANQTATNMTTIQYVNMIQDLSNVTIRNGTYAGGTFDGSSVTAVNGYFQNLSASTTSTTNLAVTSASGSPGCATFAADGTLLSTGVPCGTGSGGGGAFPFSSLADYSVVTSATTTPIWAKAGVFASSTSAYPALAVEQSGIGPIATFMGGNLGIGTSTPGSLLSIQGIANFTTATSTFYGNGLNLTNGCYAVNGVCISAGGGAGVASIAQTYGTPQTGALTFGTSSQTTNGLTVGLNITNASGAFTFAPTISGTLSVLGGGTGLSSIASSSLLIGGPGNTMIGYATSSLGLASLSSFSASAPLSYNALTGAFSISQANSSTNGYLSSGDWT